MPEVGDLTRLLTAAWPAVSARRGQTLVVKWGGGAMEEPAALTATLHDLAWLQLLGQRIVVVHGGGRPIDRALAAAGIAPAKVNGRRITDAATLTVVVRVLADEINADLVARLQSLGVAARGMTRLMTGTKLQSPDGDLGFVGEVSAVDLESLQTAWRDGELPMVPSLAIDGRGGWWNVNADDAATAVAIALRADRLAFLTDTPGILRDVRDPTSRIGRLNPTEVAAHIRSGVIAGGMVPKVQGCVAAVERGVGRVQILDGRVEHALLIDLLTGTAVGTEIGP